MTLKKILALFVGFVFALALQVPAQATTGRFTFQEFAELCIQASTSCTTDSQASAEAICNCTGDHVDGWTINGYDHKLVDYADECRPHGVELEFKRSMFGGTWKLIGSEYKC